MSMSESSTLSSVSLNSDDTENFPPLPMDGDSPLPSKPGDSDSPLPSKPGDGDSPLPSKPGDDDSPLPSKPGDGDSPLPTKPGDDDSPLPSKPGDGDSPLPTKPGDADSPLPTKPGQGDDPPSTNLANKVPPSPLPTGDTLSPLEIERTTFSPIEMFKTYADPGRKESLRSLEIPLENLLSGIISLPGGRDKRGGPILSLTQPDQRQVEMLMEVTEEEIMDMLAYFTSVPRDEERAKGFSVVLDVDIIHDFLLRKMVKALHTFQLDEHKPFHQVLFVSTHKDYSIIDWPIECNEESIELPFCQVNSYADLQEYIDKDNLTPEFGGSLEYDHHDWVRFRMQVEPFICDCVGISKRLARAIEPLTTIDYPKSIEEAQDSLVKSRMARRQTLDILHMDELSSEGERINDQMMKRTTHRLQSNPDFANTMTTIQKLLLQIGTVKGRLETLWSNRHEKLEANLKQRLFEKEANQIIDWFEEYAEEFFETHTELGESLDVAEALVTEIQQFETSTQLILQRTGVLLSSGSELETYTHIDQSALRWEMGKIKKLMTDFDERLSKRKKHLDESVQLHKLIESALDWCIESAALLSEYDIISVSSADIDPEAIKQEYDDFLQEFPAPTDEDLHRLLELMEAAENPWTKDNALFARNRVLEIMERFDYYQKALDDMVAEKRKEDTSRKELMRKSKKVVRAVDSLLSTVSGETLQEVDGVLDSSLETSGEEGVSEPDAPQQQRHSTDSQLSLRYQDLDETLMLLEMAAQNASDRLDSQRASAPPGAIEGGEMETLNPEDKCEAHRLSTHDISEPTNPVLRDDDRRVSLFCEIEDDLTAQTKHARHRRQLMEELIATEEAYIRDMQHVVDHYMPAMDDLTELPRSLIGKKNVIFSNISALLEFNKAVILPQLLQCRKCPVKLGQIFLVEEEDLLNYSSYFKNLPLQTRLMEEGGIEFFAGVQQRLNDKLNLNSYLIKPFQRITKYKLFLADMLKHSLKADLKGKLKEYYDKLKDAFKMIDFILRHGNDLLAVECLKEFPGSLAEQGKILRQGDLVLVSRAKHKRKVFLFEHSIILSKKKKVEKHAPDVFEFRSAHKTSDFSLRENIPDHPTRFELKRKKETIVLQASSEEEKFEWVQDIWDLFFSHMLQLKDQKLEEYGTRALTSVMTSSQGTLTRGRAFGHSVRRSIRHSSASRINSREMTQRPSSQLSAISNVSSEGYDELTAMVRPGPMRRTYSPSSPRVMGTFVDLRTNRISASSLSSLAETDISEDRMSIISTSSGSTVTSLNFCVPANDHEKRRSRLISDVRKAEDRGKNPEDTLTNEDRGKNPEDTLTNEQVSNGDEVEDYTPTTSHETFIFGTPV